MPQWTAFVVWGIGPVIMIAGFIFFLRQSRRADELTRQTVRRFSWVWSLGALLLFVSLPIGLMIQDTNPGDVPGVILFSLIGVIVIIAAEIFVPGLLERVEQEAPDDH